MTKYDDPYNYLRNGFQLYSSPIEVTAKSPKIFKCPECEKDTKKLHSNNKYHTMGFMCIRCWDIFHKSLLNYINNENNNENNK